ncbi:MAG TPA: YdeI/OmpD-associated family protein [Flavitalea sp.]|nr:YdeI/OmpD-associated family protein [Flavitalea sp.]
MLPTDVVFFKNAAEFRQWLKSNHSKAQELQVGFYKVGSGRQNMTWSEAVDEALCFGWIDGVRNSIDATSYTNRFTPRRKSSNWSEINLRKIEQLIKEGRMTKAGLAAFESRKVEKKGEYSYEAKRTELPVEYLSVFKKKKKALSHFNAMAPSYRRTAIHWVMMAKQEQTRMRRLEQLIADSSLNQKVKPFRNAAG